MACRKRSRGWRGRRGWERSDHGELPTTLYPTTPHPNPLHTTPHHTTPHHTILHHTTPHHTTPHHVVLSYPAPSAVPSRPVLSRPIPSHTTLSTNPYLAPSPVTTQNGSSNVSELASLSSLVWLPRIMTHEVSAVGFKSTQRVLQDAVSFRIPGSGCRKPACHWHPQLSPNYLH